MSFDTNQKTKLDIAFKKLLNKSTLNINDVANSEPIGTNVSISTSTIFAEAITSAPGVTPTTADSNYDSDTTVEHIRFVATAHPDSNVGGKYHAYTLSLPATYETRSTQANKATAPFGNNKVLYESLGKLQLVPPSFGGSYAAKPYRAGTENVIGSGTEIPPLATEAWVIDYYSGILYLENPTNDLITFVDAYLYIGNMADQTGASSDLISEGDAKVETTDTGSGNSPTKITFSTGYTATNIPKAKWNITHGGHILPEVTEEYDIGSAEKKVRHLFLSDNSLTIGNTTLSKDDNNTTLKWGGNALVEANQVVGSETVVYCDSKRSDTYAEDGSFLYPYKKLSDAIAAKCTNTATETVVFCLASGDYLGSISITKTSTITDPNDSNNTIPNPGLSQEVYIIGENKESVRIMGSSTFDTGTGDVLFLRRFKNVSIQNLTIMNGAYGFYPRECTTTSIINCIFKNCGSSGDTTMHDGSGSEAQQAKYKWSSGDTLAINTSNGGAMRVRACNDIEIRDNLIEYCFRGFRIQDCHRGNISNNRVHKILDNGIYLAAGSYDGSTSSGCENLSVTNNIVEHAGHHGLLVVGGRNNTFKNNVVKHSWGTAYNGAHAVNVDLIGNYFYNNNCKDYNGYGPGGEHLAQIYAYALTSIDQSANTKYLLQVVNNVFEESGNGSTGSSRLFYINSAKAELPAAGQVLTVHNNVHDCTTDYDITDWEVTYPKATFSSDEISEGTTNQYYTDARAISAVQSTDIDMGTNTITTTGQIKYSNVYATEADLPSASTYHGMFAHVHATGKAYYAHGGSWIKILDESSYTGPSAAEVRAHISAGTGVSITDGAVSIGQAVANDSDVQFKNLILSGDLTVNGDTTTVSTTNTVVSDTLMELGNGTNTPANDAGIVIERGSEDNAFIGFDESEDKFIVGTGNFTGASTGDLTVTTGTLVANLEGNVTGNATSLTNLNATVAELNILDGNTAATDIALEATDKLVINDDGNMVQVAMSKVKDFTNAASELDDLSDVNLTTPADNQIMQYNGTTNDWENVLPSHLLVSPILVTTDGNVTSDGYAGMYKMSSNNHYVYTNSGGVTDDTVYWSLPGCSGNTGASYTSGSTIIIENMTTNTITVCGRGINNQGKVIERAPVAGQATGATKVHVAPGSQAVFRFMSTGNDNDLGSNGKWLMAWLPNAEILNPNNSTDNAAYENSPLVWDKYIFGSLEYGRWRPQGMTTNILQVRGKDSDNGELKIWNAANDHYTSLISANTADVAYTLPATVGSANEFLSLSSVGSGTGTLAWSPLNLNVNDLGDATISNLASNEVLKYNGSAWANVALSDLEFPLLTVKNTVNNADGAILKLIKDKGAAGAANDVAGLIEFYADNNKSGGQEEQVKFAEIKTQVENPFEGAEGGKLSLSVANFDGTLVEAVTINGSSQFTDSTCDYNDSTLITVDDVSLIKFGMSVSGTGIPAGSYITEVENKDDPDNTFRINQSTTGGAYTNQTLTFGNPDDHVNVTIGTDKFSSSVTIPCDIISNGDITANKISLGASTVIASTGNTFDASSTTFTNGVWDGFPLIQVKNTNSGNVGSTLWFTQDRGAGADGDTIGTITFRQENDADEPFTFANIDCKVSDASDSAESGKITFKVASHDGELAEGIVIDGGSHFTVTNCSYNNSTTITVSSTALLEEGMYVTGDGIPANADVASVTNSTTFELSVSTTGGTKTNETLTFGNTEDEVDVTLGNGAKSTVTIPGILNLGGTDITATAAELNILNGVTSTTAELNILDGVTSTTAELNILDGVTSTATELNILDGVTATTAEINLLDGGTSASSTTTIVNGDRIILNDDGIMKQVDVSDLKDYTGGGGSSTLAALTDTDTNGAGNGHVLRYETGTQTWKAEALPTDDYSSLYLANIADVNPMQLTVSANSRKVLTYDHAADAGKRFDLKYVALTYDATKGSADWTGVVNSHYSVNTSGASGDVTMTLPAAAEAGTEIRVKLMDNTHSLIVKPTGTEKLDGTSQGTTTLSTPLSSITLVDNGSDGWEII